MQKVVLDSDIIIDHLREANFTLEQILGQIFQKQIQGYISSVVITEIYSGQDTKREDRRNLIKKILERLEFVAPSKEISQGAGFLMRDYRNLKLADATIAATVLSLNAKLATRNKKDFEDIEGLKFFKLSNNKISGGG